MSLPIQVIVGIVVVACLAVLAWGVYIDHVRRQRRRRGVDRRREHAESFRVREAALQPIGRPVPGLSQPETHRWVDLDERIHETRKELEA